MTITDRTLLNETVSTGADVVVRVEMENFSPVRDRTTLNLTANGSLVAQQSVTVGVDARRTVYLRTTFETPGRYVLGVDGVEVGTVTVTEVGTGTSTATRTQSSETTPGTPVPTPTQGPAPTDSSGRSPPSTSSVEETVTPGLDEPTGTEAIVALGMSLMLLYGVGVAVYVVKE